MHDERIMVTRDIDSKTHTYLFLSSWLSTSLQSIDARERLAASRFGGAVPLELHGRLGGRGRKRRKHAGS
jgi:hypothetical protein